MVEIQTQTAELIEQEPKPQPEAYISLLPVENDELMLEMKRRQLLVMDECHVSGRFKISAIVNKPRIISTVTKLLIDR